MDSSGKEAAASRVIGVPCTGDGTLKKLLLLLALFAALLSAAGWWLAAGPGKTPDADDYTFVTAEFGRAAETVGATGVVQAREVFPVGTELTGKVVEICADFNQVVEEGDVLLRLDDRAARQRLKQADVGVELARVALKQAEAARDTAEKAFERERTRPVEVRRQADLDLVESQLRSAEVVVEAAVVRIQEAEETRRQAELALEMTVVRVPVLAPMQEGSMAPMTANNGVGALSPHSPTSGRTRRTFVVLERKVTLNQQLVPPASGHLFTLAGGLEHMQVLAQVAEGDLNKVTRDMPVEFSVSGGGDREPTFHGKVEDVRLTPVNDRGAVFYKIVIDVENQPHPNTNAWLLRPGQTATVDVLRRVHESVWKVPSAALNFQPDGDLSGAAKERLAAWQARPDSAQWRTVWVLGGDGKPRPLFVRTGGKIAGGEAGVQDTQFSEVLEWEPGLAPRPDPDDTATYPRFIVGAPAVKKGGLFNAPKIKF
jgi:HlyD family secretion protein